MNHTSKMKQCLVALKRTILVAQKLILLLLTWPFPLPQSKSAQKKEEWELKNNCKRCWDSSVTNTVWGGGRNGSCCSAPTRYPAGLGVGHHDCACSCPSPVQNTPNWAPDGFCFEEKGGKDSKQQLELLREGKTTTTKYYEGGHHLGNMPDRLNGWRQGQGEMQSSRNVDFLLYSNDVLLRSQDEDRKSQRHEAPDKQIKRKHWKDERRVKRSWRYNTRGKFCVIQIMRITMATRKQIHPSPHQTTHIRN